MTIERNRGGFDVLRVHGSKVSTLARYLDASIPIVWIVNHFPVEASMWRTMRLPISESRYVNALTRGATYDLQLPTSQFLEEVGAFDSFGIDLFQMRRPVPDTLIIDRIPEDQRDTVLVLNGAFMHIYLPHAGESATVVCYEVGYLAKRVEQLTES